MAEVTESVDVEVPLETVYNRWTQFEAFPRFMEGVEEVRQLDNTHLHWVAEVAGKRREWDAEITEQRPDERIVWRSTNGKTNTGVVTFHRLSDSMTRITVQMQWEAEGVGEKLGAVVGADERRVRGDLERFKEMIERRGTETGAWRGEVRRPDEPQVM